MNLTSFLTQLIALSMAPASSTAEDGSHLSALIYRGSTGCEGCSESIEDLLDLVYPNIKVTYAGPHEAVQINAESLRKIDILAQPGGPDLDAAWEEAKPYAPAVRDFVAGGGRYLGICLGAFLAGPDQGFGLLPKGDRVTEEISEPGAQVTDMDDTTIQVNWTFTTGPKRGTTENKRWVYFQDGAAFELQKGSKAKVLARYSSNGNVSAILNAYGKGWVANVGTHPEADQSWYDDAHVKNPEGVKFDIGEDLVRALVTAGR